MQSRRIIFAVSALLLIISVGTAYWLSSHAAKNTSDLTLSDFYFLHRETQSDEVFDRLGAPSRTLGSGITRYQYDLVDGNVVELVFNSGQLEAWILGKTGDSINYFEVAGEARICAETEPTEVVPDLILSLENNDPIVRKEAAQALGCIGSEAAEAIPALSRTLGDEKRWVRIAASWALGQIGPEAIPSLTQALGNQDASIRAAAAWSLGYMGPEAEEVIPVLSQALGDEDETVRQAVAWTLGEIGSAAVPTLVQIVENEDLNENMRKSAAIALGYAGTEAEDAIPNLVLALEDESEEVRTGAKVALWYITGHPVSDVDWWKEWWEDQQ
jgi:hypothetical protein